MNCVQCLLLAGTTTPVYVASPLAMGEIIVFVVFALFWLAYFFLRFGPKRCPNCRRWTWGFFGIPVGIRRMHFRCKACGAKFQGNWRLPL